MAAKPTSAPAHQPPDLSSLCLAITEHAPLPMATVEGASLIVRYVNPAFCRLMDKPAEQLVGIPFCEMLPERDECVTLLDRVFHTGKPESHVEQEHSKPHPVFWSFTMWPVLADERPVGVMIQVTETAQLHEKTLAMNEALMLGSLRQHELTEAADSLNVQLQREITERKQAEEASREAEERFRFMSESMPQKIFTAKPNGDVDYFNASWTEFTGLTFESIRDWGWTQLIHPDDVAGNVRIWQHSIDTGEPFHFEHRFRGANGEYRWHISQAVALKDDAGKVVMWVGSNTDVHEVKEADRRKNEFLAMLAHELRNPLAPIRNMLEIMKRADGNGDLIEQARSTMERQLGQMTRLIDDLLDVSRISRGSLDLRREQVELASVVHHAIEACLPSMDTAGHELTVTLPPQPVYLHADPMRLAQAVENLLSNACKYTDKGGRIWLTVERAGVEAVIRVRDTGIGIAAGELPRIFDMFMQVDSSLERSVSGLGIGLTLVKNLVEAHGGTVAVHSDGVGQGSEFVVRLPVLVETPKPPLPLLEPIFSTPTTTTARRILVVDDNRDSANSLAMLLNLTGHETLTAYDGLKAVEAAATFRPDVVLLDIGLPKLNGYDAARRIREQPWGRSMVLLALTGWGQDEDRQKSRDAGFNGHLVKPVDHAALTELLAESPPPSA